LLLALAGAAVGVAAILGGATGFGASLLATPLLLLVGLPVPEVVVINLTATLVTRIAVVCRWHRHVTWRRVALLGIGSVPGAWLGSETATLVDSHVLKPVAGVLVTLAGLRMAWAARRTARPPCSPSAGWQALTGLVGGYLSTSTSLNGPPTALMLARAGLTPVAFIADLAGYFVVTNVLALTVLGLRDQIPHSALWPALPVCVAAALAGNIVGGWVGRALPTRTFRLVVITLVVIAGIATAVG
jgi:uncharacterized protein